MKKYRACGVLGYNYSHFGFNKGEIDQGSTDFPALIKKLHANRCALFPEQYEILVGFSVTGKNYLGDKDLGYAPIPKTDSTKFHMMVSRNSKRGKELSKLINDELREMETSGRLQTLLKKHIP